MCCKIIFRVCQNLAAWKLFVRFPPVVLDAEHLTVVGDGLALEMRTIVTQFILYPRELGIEFVFFAVFAELSSLLANPPYNKCGRGCSVWP